MRVIVDGTWGFAAAVDFTAEAAAAAEAVDVARVAAALSTERIELAAESAHGDVTWVSDYQADPFGVSLAEKIALLAGWSSGLLADDRVDHVDASLLQVRECKFYSDGAATATQQRVRVHPELTAVAVQPAAGSRRCGRWPGRPAAAMSTSPAPAGTSLQSLPDHPRVDRPRDRA